MIPTSIINSYSPLFLNIGLDFNVLGKTSLYIPRFKLGDLLELCRLAEEQFKREDILLRIESPFILVGDIHGNIRDLLRIFARNGSPMKNRYLLMGDYVDRGELSIEVITLLLALKVSYPHSIYLIRGNHEFVEVNSIYGFKTQVLEMYNEDLYNAFNSVFDYMPLAALLDGKTFVVHGGISQHMQFIEDILRISRPVKNFTSGEFHNLVTDLVWSDPIATHSHYSPSQRGFGYLFGLDAFHEFQKRNNVKFMIRAHQCVANGVEKFKFFNIYTVFSCSSYSENPRNRAGVIHCNSNKITCHTYKPIRILKKSKAVFKEIECDVESTPLCARARILGTSKSPQRDRMRISASMKSISLDQEKNPLVPKNDTISFSCRPKVSLSGSFSMYSRSSLSSLPSIRPVHPTSPKYMISPLVDSLPSISIIDDSSDGLVMESSIL